MTDRKLPKWAEESVSKAMKCSSPYSSGVRDGIRLVLDRLERTKENDIQHCPKDCDCFFAQGRQSVRDEVTQDE